MRKFKKKEEIFEEDNKMFIEEKCDRVSLKQKRFSEKLNNKN